MRFFKDGPNIPDQLLERRDQGRVVFLCGAGVSLNANMPTFFELTKYVVDFFDPPQNSAIESEFKRWIEDDKSGKSRPKTPLDQIFHLLYQEFGREEVNALVAERLWKKKPRKKKSKEHSIIARISSDQEGKPQVVTTNFDRLFELETGEANSTIFKPPAFPDINLGIPITGLTYLHGRLEEPSAKLHPYVLSSADFGRAYLSEGWATNFIRSLLKNYTVVLVGYQGEDPPIKYLLQGLNHDGLSDRSNLYAFDKGEPEDIEAKWRDRGVTAIACKDYPSLWQSLEAWADRADDPRKWRSKVIDSAMKGPRKLSAHERGQVAHLVRTTPGARLFARTNPPPPAEWLCVFDASCRIAKMSSGYGEEAETFDPFDEYGLDDDPSRSSESDQRSDWVHDHILEWRRGDTNPSTFHRLSGREVVGTENMPPRLVHLTKWIAKNVDSPITAWWAARQRGLHPRLAKEFQFELGRKTELNPDARRIWYLIVEYQSDSSNFYDDFNWFDIKDRIINEGWTPSVLRYFEAATAPRLFLERPLGIGASKPPFNGWNDTSFQELARWESKFPDRHGEGLEIPDKVLESVFNIAEGHFRRAARLLEDLDTVYFSAPTCYPEREVNGQDNERDSDFRWFLDLFERMVKCFPNSARGYVAAWPVNEKYYFSKLKLFALNNVELFGANEAAKSVQVLRQEIFWDSSLCRELLFLLNDRWKDFSEANRVALSERLLNGPEKMKHWSDEEYPNIRDGWASRYARWLTLNGSALAEEQATRLARMISGIPEWVDGWASSIVEAQFSNIRSIDTDEAPDLIIDVPVAEVIERAKTARNRDFDNFIENRPFTGLVKVKPRKALSSLTHAARSGEYPQNFWAALIRNWPEEANQRLSRVFLLRLQQLPDLTIRELRHSIGHWIEHRFLSAFSFDKSLAWDTFDHLVLGLISEDGASSGSGIVEIKRGDKVIERSRRTYRHALNSPLGNAVAGLIRALDYLQLAQGQKIPEEFKSRLESLITAPGEGSDYSAAILTKHINWLYHRDPEWVKETIVPWFDFDHPSSEPAWNGFLFAATWCPQEIGVTIKPLLLDLFPRLYQWDRDKISLKWRLSLR